jgi:hypothetical protein
MRREFFRMKKMVILAGLVVAVAVAALASLGGADASVPFLDDMKCYKAQVLPNTPKFQKQEVILIDQFEEKETEVRYPVNFCTPVDKGKLVSGDGEGAGPGFTPNLQCYAIRDTSGQSKFEEREVVVFDQFAEEQELIVHRASRLCEPASKGIKSGAAVAGSTGPLGSMKCYLVRYPPGKDRFERTSRFLLDQFEEKLHIVVKPVELCTPVDKFTNDPCKQIVIICGTGVQPQQFPIDHLMCYQIRYAPGYSSLKSVRMFTADQFGELAIKVWSPNMLCVVAEKFEECRFAGIGAAGDPCCLADTSTTGDAKGEGAGGC